MIRLDKFKKKSIGVFGLGTAGLAAIRSLLLGEAKVYVWDDQPAARETFMADLGLAKHGHLKLDAVENWPWGEMSGVVLSPGVPLTHPKPHPVVDLAHKYNTPIMGEVDLLYSACPEANYIGITGTNGKSTTTALIGHILHQNNYLSQVGANFGVPALALRPLDDKGFYVLEMSSYQLDLVNSVIFDAAVMLNVSPDHLDRHGDMQGYVKAKRRIFQRQREKGGAFIGLDDGYCRDIYIDLMREHRPNLFPFTVEKHEQVKNRIEVTTDGILRDLSFEGGFTHDLKTIARIKGKHNWQNIAAAYAVARYFGLRPEKIIETVHSFPGLPHRLEVVTTLNEVTFLNDSKATNADATARALEPFENIYWILGGRQKEGGIESLAKYFPKIIHAFLIGEAQDAFATTLEGKVPYTKCGELGIATHKAANMAFSDIRSGGVVLLSPACASFDQWRSYEARGDAFRHYVREIAGAGGR